MAQAQHTLTLASLEEAITVLFCLVDDTYALLNPKCQSHESLKKLSDSEVLTLALFPQLRGVESERSFLRDVQRFFVHLFRGVAVALLTGTLFVAGLPLLYDWFRTVYIHDLGGRDLLSAHLTQLGMSVDFYIAYLLLLGIIPAVAYFAVATIIFWRKSDEPMAPFTAFLLVLFGATIWGSTEELGVIHPILE
jgi:hypothetical protein